MSAHRQGFRLALLFDYDGTLTPIVDHPALAHLAPDMHQLLRRLTRQANVKVGIISGRSLDDVQKIVGLPGLYYAGNSGLELDLLGERICHPRAQSCRSLVRTVVGRLEALTMAYPGAWVEDKRLGLTLHYRKVALHRRLHLLARARQLVRPYLHRLRVVTGPMAWEITPALGWDKGSAVRQILESIGPPTFALYAGDGANDAAALATTTTFGGLALGIGAGTPGSVHFRLRDPAALANLLTCLAESLDSSSAKPVA